MYSVSVQVGLAISNCILLTGMLQWGVRQSAEVGKLAFIEKRMFDTFLSKSCVQYKCTERVLQVENLMTAVERVMEYTKLPQEDEASKPGNVPSKSWPQQGVIQFSDVYLRYDKDEKDVLKAGRIKRREKPFLTLKGYGTFMYEFSRTLIFEC